MNTENTVAPVMAIVLATESSDPNFNGDCDYAVVRLTPELVEQVRRRVELARQAGDKDDDLCEMQFWCGTAEFYDSGLLEACQDALAAAEGDEAARRWLAGLEQEGHALLPPAVDLAARQPQRTECDLMVVRCSPSSHKPQYEIAWSASPKHSDVCVTTRDLPLTTLEGYVGSKLADDRAAVVERLADKAESAGLQPEDLDETVHELASSVAADMNNGGLEEQVHYLVEGLGAEHAERQIDELIKERQKEGNSRGCRLPRNQLSRRRTEMNDMKRYELRLDGPAFRAQRELLLRIADLARRKHAYEPAPGDEALLEGLLNLSDAIADQAHDRHGIDCLLHDGEGEARNHD